MHELVARRLQQHDRGRVLLSLRGDAIASGAFVVFVYGLVGVPMVVAMSIGKAGSGLQALMLLLALALVGLRWLRFRGPSDLVITETRLHLIWRLASYIQKQRSIALTDITRATLEKKRWWYGRSFVHIELRDGSGLRLSLVRRSKYGVVQAYDMLANATQHVFERAPSNSDQNHVAFANIVKDLADHKG